MTFTDRVEAGRALAERLAMLEGGNNVVLALPRGGVTVGYEVALRLRAPLDVVVAHKLGAPGDPELAIGALALVHGPQVVLNRRLVEHLKVSSDYLAAETARQSAEAQRRLALYRGGREPASVEGKVAIVVDDGIVTGATARAALIAVRAAKPSRVVLATPLASKEAIAVLKGEVDDFVAVRTPEPFIAVGSHYLRFEQVEDDEVVRLLASPPGLAE